MRKPALLIVHHAPIHRNSYLPHLLTYTNAF
jgi:hypothetical protein